MSSSMKAPGGGEEEEFLSLGTELHVVDVDYLVCGDQHRLGRCKQNRTAEELPCPVA